MCGIVLRAREGNDGSVAELVQGPQSCPRWGAPLAARVAVGARVASEMRRARCGYQQTKPWAWMGAAKPRRSRLRRNTTDDAAEGMPIFWMHWANFSTLSSTRSSSSPCGARRASPRILFFLHGRMSWVVGVESEQSAALSLARAGRGAVSRERWRAAPASGRKEARRRRRCCAESAG